MTSIFVQKGDRGFKYSKIMRIWRRKKVDDTGCIGRTFLDSSFIILTGEGFIVYVKENRRNEN